MSAFHREVAKYFAKYAAATSGSSSVAVGGKGTSAATAAAATSSSNSIMQYTPLAKQPSHLRTLLEDFFAPVWYRFFRGPLDRWNQAAMGKYLREHGLMYDDLYSDKEPVIERALELLPEDLQIARYRRILRATHLNHIRLFLPLEEQNYDPFIPYLAPFVEEAKFQLQEEEELLGYHMWDRRLYSGGCTGFGDLEPGVHFLVSFPNMYGGGSGPHNKAHLSSFTASPLYKKK